MTAASIVSGMISATKESMKETRARITSVRYGDCSDGVDRILFDFDGKPHSGHLAGRNADLFLTDIPHYDSGIALRVILDGCSSV